MCLGLWLIFKERRVRLSAVVIALVNLLGFLVSTSKTAYLVVTAMALLSPFLYLLLKKRGVRNTQRVKTKTFILLLCILLLASYIGIEYSEEVTKGLRRDVPGKLHLQFHLHL